MLVQICFIGNVDVRNDNQCGQNRNSIQRQSTGKIGEAEPDRGSQYAVSQKKHQQIEADESIHDQRMDGPKQDEQIDAVDGKGEYGSKRRKEQGTEGTPAHPNQPQQEKHAGKGKQGNVQASGKSVWHQANGFTLKMIKKDGVCQLNLVEKLTGLEIDTAGGVPTHLRMKQPEKDLGNAEIKPHGQDQKSHIGKAPAKDSPKILSVHQLTHENQHQNPGSEGDVALINTQGKNHTRQGHQTAPQGFFLEQPGSERRKKERHAVAAAGEHIAEGAGEGGKGENQPGSQPLDPLTAQLEGMDQQADGHRQQSDGNNPVNPWHGYIRKYIRQNFQSPAAEGQGSAFAEQG